MRADKRTAALNVRGAGLHEYPPVFKFNRILSMGRWVQKAREASTEGGQQFLDEDGERPSTASCSASLAERPLPGARPTLRTEGPGGSSVAQNCLRKRQSALLEAEPFALTKDRGLPSLHCRSQDSIPQSILRRRSPTVEMLLSKLVSEGAPWCSRRSESPLSATTRLYVDGF